MTGTYRVRVHVEERLGSALVCSKDAYHVTAPSASAAVKKALLEAERLVAEADEAAGTAEEATTLRVGLEDVTLVVGGE